MYSSENVSKCFENFSGIQPDKKEVSQFIDSFMELGCGVYEKKGWAEKTPHTVLVADTLFDLYPSMSYIHIFREPKDIYCSLLEQKWGPKNVDDFVVFYNNVMTKSFVVQSKIPLENYFTVSLEKFVENKEKLIQTVFNFVEVGCSEEIYQNLCDEVNPENAHIDRWKGKLSDEEGQAIEQKCYKIYKHWQHRESQSFRV